MSLAFSDMIGNNVATEKMTIKCYYNKGTDATATTSVDSGVDTSITDIAGTNDGTTAVGQLRVTATPESNQVAQGYTGTVSVTITPA